VRGSSTSWGWIPFDFAPSGRRRRLSRPSARIAAEVGSAGSAEALLLRIGVSLQTSLFRDALPEPMLPSALRR